MWSVINELCNALFDGWLWPFKGLTPIWQILALALPTTILSLLIFRFTSNQDGIRAEKDKIKAYLLELRLFRDDLGVMLKAQGQILKHTLVYMRYALVPMAFMILPFILILVQVESRFAYRSLNPGEQVIVSVTVDAKQPVSQMVSELDLPDGLSKETPALRIDSTGEILWRIRADKPGVYRATFQIGERSVEKEIMVGENITHLSPVLYRSDDIRTIGYPAESALGGELPVSTVEVIYPRARGEFLGLSSASWLLFLFTLILGFLLRGGLGVTF